jgi:2-iminobutanoate/2-iminopropanoate deaminase
MDNALNLEGYPISPFVVDGDRVYTAGIIPIDPNSGEVVTGDIRVQTARALDNLEEILARAGARLDDVLVVDVVLSDVADFDGFNEVYAARFAAPHPARRTIGGQLALPGLLIEVQAVARIALT